MAGQEWIIIHVKKNLKDTESYRIAVHRTPMIASMRALHWCHGTYMCVWGYLFGHFSTAPVDVIRSLSPSNKAVVSFKMFPVDFTQPPKHRIFVQIEW